MKNEIEHIQRLLEAATAPGNAPADALDPETASLRETWVAFGEMLEAAQPPALNAILLPGEGPNKNSPRPLGEGQGVRARHRPHWPPLLALGLLAVSLLVGIVTVWMLHGVNRQENGPNVPATIVSNVRQNERHVVPATRVHGKTALTADEPQWDDALDEQFTQVDWQMTCIKQNQTYRTDAFGLVQYRVEQFRQAIQTDSL